MTKPNFTASLVIGAVLSSPLASHAAIVGGYGAYASASTASNCPSYCTTAGGGDFQYDADGGEFSDLAFAEELSYAEGRAQASLTGSTYLPELKVFTSADLAKGSGATAMGVQGFTYNGAGSASITLDLNLHGSITNNPSGYAFNQITASIAVLIGSDLGWYPDFGTLVFEVSSLDQGGLEYLGLSGSGLNQTSTGSITFNIDPGQDFYVVAELNANSNNGIADAWNTLTMSFEDATGLSAASVNTVPVPAAVWLFGSGLVGLWSVGRRRLA